MQNNIELIASALTLILITFIVAFRLLFVRVREMRQKRVHPQSASTSLQMASRLEDVRASDNFRNLFEVPVLFYVLVAIALAINHIPGWLVWGAWIFVALRGVHSLIHCTYNKVMHRFPVFFLGFTTVIVLWVSFFLTIPQHAA